jgi:VCBS repeat-containing protein
MRPNYLNATLKTAVLVTIVLLLGAGLAFAQQQVNLTAGPSSLTMPDGSSVPMWGYSCGTAVSNSTASCAPLNAVGSGWSPVVITVPSGQDLQINLTNSLSFTPAASTTPNNIPTSLVIVGQLGGGLGTAATYTASPNHPVQQTTWPIANAPGATNTPPPQGPRVQSFSTEVAAGGTGALCWGPSCATPSPALRPGTYLLESGTHPSIQGPMGLYGIVVVTSAPTTTAPGCAYPGATAGTCSVPYNAEVPLLFSEIDPVQNNSVNAAVNTVNFSETAVWSGQPGGCGNTASTTYNTCYPPAVNYSPLYYLINGVAFDKTNANKSLFAAAPSSATNTVSGSVLVRFVNAGLRMHVPSIVGAQTGTASPAASGFSLIAEDSNPLPGAPRVQSEVFMAAGKTYDVMINVPAAGGSALPIYDRELSLSGNATARDAGMLAYLGVNGAGLPSAPALANAVARNDAYVVVPGNTLTVSDPGKGVIANDFNVYGVGPSAPTASHGTVSLNANGTFTYIPDASWTASTPTTTDTFTYQANGGATSATVTLNACDATSGCLEANSGILMNGISYTSKVATYLSIKPPGILSVDKDSAGYPLSVDLTTIQGLPVCTSTGTPTSPPTPNPCIVVDANGGFTAYAPGPGSGSYSFSYKAKNSQGTQSANSATVMLTFLAGSGLQVSVKDGKDKTTQLTDYRWVIEEDRTFYINPNNTTNNGTNIVPTFGTNFHTSYMPVVAEGCVGTVSCESGQSILGSSAVCDIGNGKCRQVANAQQTPVDPSQVNLDPSKHYYISVLPGDAANPFINGGGAPITDTNGNPYRQFDMNQDCDFTLGTGTCGHGMGGAPIAPGQTNVTVLVQRTPFPPSKLSVFVFEDDFPLNGEQDAGGGVDVLAPNEPGLGGFNITLFDDAGGTGDATGQMTYDMFNQPLVNSLAGTIDPATQQDACPISTNSRAGTIPSQPGSNSFIPDPTQTGITGTIVTCPKYEADGTTLSPLAGQAVIANLMPGRYGVVATPAADRIGRGEEWLQTNTLDGQKAHDSFLRIGEPSFFQEFGPAGYHVSIGFANPAIISGRLAGVCNGTDINITGSNCNNTIKGLVTTERMSRTPDERLYSSGDNSSFAFTQCYVSVGDADGEDFAFTKCDQNGNFTLSGLPDGQWRVTVFDQWNDMLVDGLSTPVGLNQGASGGTTNMEIAMNQWQANIYTSTFFDSNGDGVRDNNEAGLTLVPTNIRFRDGSFSNFNNTDLNGNAGFNEVFPLFSWYVVEADTTRYKNTGTHVVYDAGGPADGTCTGSTAPCGNSQIAANMANTQELVSLPSNLRIPGAVYCDNADCNNFSIAKGPISGGSSGPSTGLSTGRIDPPWVTTEGWQGFSGQNSFLEFGKTPYVTGETGGIAGHVVYASTRPFDDPQLLLQTSWEPLVPGVTINLYKEGTAPDGSTSLTLIDHTTTSSFDDWAQGFRSDGIPNMNCPGQMAAPTSSAPGDLFFFTLFNQPMWLDEYNNVLHGTSTQPKSLPNSSQFKCYDGMHNWNQLQPAPYDGKYQFPSVTSMDPVSGKPMGTNCTGCVPNPDKSDPYRNGTPMLPAGKYVVEVVVPPGYELVKEEDKNILIGDNYIAPVTQEFGGLGNIFILPDQAEVGTAYNSNNAQNPTQDLGRTTLPSHEADTGSMETFWPCVGESRIVPDYISLFPGSSEVAPFAGATRNLCDRKEVTLQDQTQALAKFYLFTSTHVAAHFTGVITDDFTSEFDPFSPQFGEKFSPSNMPISLKDWTGTEISRVYTDQWGTYNGLTYSTWEVNPPNPTGYAPTMMVTCMNDPGTGSTPDPLFNPAYSQFCYEIPFMPGQTQYMDTPVVPTSAFAGAGYNNPDCAYPDATPAISEVDGTGKGPWVQAPGATLTITALGDQNVTNYGYSGPSATAAPYNQKTVTRHYGFGTQCTSPTAGSATCNTMSSVTIGGQPATITGWSDTQITVTVPSNVPACALQQQAQYGGSPAQCGQLQITAGNGRQSIDSVTVTIGGKSPTHVTSGMTIQGAIDAAAPGDLIMVDPGVYNEILLMWKPVRLQGVGAASSVINANSHPAGKMDPWRAQVNCLFGLALNGQPYTGNGASGGSNPYDPNYNPANSTGMSCPGTGWNYFTGGPNNPQVDRLPLEGVLGWDTSVNGNLAEMLQEPTLMGAYEGAGITVLAKGVNIPANSTNIFGTGAESAFPTGTTLLTAADCTTGSNGANSYSSNFQCNPSSIDGLAITDSSQGGGGILVHAWGHNLQIANNRVYNNTGTLTGGITVGQGESPDAYLAGTPSDSDPGSCQTNSVNNLQLPYCFDTNVNVHNNSVTLNSSIGDELFSSTPAGAGGVTMCVGADYYKFNYNWVCGNLSTGDGGGFVHLGFIWNGDIEHNTIMFNQSTNPTVPTNGGGIMVMGAPPDGVTAAGIECGGTAADADCVPGLSDGAGPNLTINANLIMGNAAESGSGGGVRFQGLNGTEVSIFPTSPQYWNSATVTNNIIANNVAGWDGGGISLQDALNVNIINNTIVSNDSTASSGVLFNTLGAPLASSSGTNCMQAGGTASCPQPAGLVAVPNSPQLLGSFTQAITCPANHPNCGSISFPYLANNLFWQNRSFFIAVGGLGTGTTNQQNVVSLYNSSFNGTPATQAGSQAATGACPSGSSYWDIGVRGDTGPGNHGSGFTLAPQHSILTNASENGNGTGNKLGTDPKVTSQYCNGSRVPPENGGLGYQVPAGISDATVPNPIFNLTPTATVDEGNNWINISWGPLAMTSPANGNVLGNYAPQSTSPVVDAVPTNSPTYSVAPTADFFGHPRPDVAGTQIDIGAVEVPGSAYPNAGVSPTSLAFGSVTVGTTSAAKTVTLSNTGDAALSIGNISVTAPFFRPGGTAGGTCSTSTGLGIGGTCTINVVFTPTVGGPATGSLTISGMNDPANPTLTVALTGTGVVPPTGNVNPTSLAFGNQANNTTSAIKTTTLTNSGSLTLTISSISISPSTNSQFARNNTVANNCGTNVAPGGSCTIGVTFHPTSSGLKNANLVIVTNAVNGNPPGTFTVPLSGTGVAMSVNPTSLAFGSQPVGTTSAAQTLTLSNGSGSSRTITITVTAPFVRTTGTGNCGGTLGNNSSCTIYVVYSPTQQVTSNGTVTITATGSTVTNSPVTLTGTGIAPPSIPALPVLDNFNRANATTLGSNWSQLVAFGIAAIQVNNNQAFCNNTPCAFGGWALWNGANNVLSARQAAAFTFASTPSSNTITPALILKSTGGTNAMGLQTNFIRVLYQTGGGGSVQIATTTNGGGAFTTVGSIAGSFANGDTMTAFVDQTGTVFVWKTTAANVTTLLGGFTLPSNANNLWTTGGGRIGMALAPGARGDNFAGATVP